MRRRSWFALTILSAVVLAMTSARPARLRAASLTPYGGTPWAIPGTIRAENFDEGGEGIAYHDTTAGNLGGEYRDTDVDIQSSSEGGYNLGWNAAGEWLNYTVNVASAGSYTVQLRVASIPGSSLHVGFNTSSNVWDTVTVPATGGYQNWTTVSTSVNLGVGRQQMTLLFDTGHMNISYINVIGSGASAPSPSGLRPYGGVAWPVPGAIEAENFDEGGEGIAYHDTTSGNTGGEYRNTDVDIQASSEGGYNLGWIAASEWLNYTVNVASAGTYTVQLRVASPNGASLHVGFNASRVWNSLSIPPTGGWQSWTTVSTTVSLAAGQQQLTLLFDTNGLNLNYINAVAGNTSPDPPPVNSSGTTASVATWNLQVDDGSTYHARMAMDYFMAMGPRPQILVVEEAHQSLLTTYLDELQAQTGQTWDAVFQTHCPLGAWNGSWCTSAEDEGVGVFSSLPITGSGYTYLPYADGYHSARAVVRAAVNVNGVVVQVFAVHLQPNNATARYSSMSVFRGWAAGFSTPQIVGGDFNADPDQIDISAGMGGAFVEAWSVVGSGMGYTSFTPNPWLHIDYWFSDVSGKAAAQSAQVVTSPGTLSDHYPVRVTFSFRP